MRSLITRAPRAERGLLAGDTHQPPSETGGRAWTLETDEAGAQECDIDIDLRNCCKARGLSGAMSYFSEVPMVSDVV